MYKVLQGDKSDNIPGIKGSGHKTLQKRLPFLFESNKVTLNQISKYSKEHINEVKFYQNISNSKDQLKLNYKLMQLYNANMSGKNKLDILGRVHEPISRLVKYKVITMSMEDKIYSILRNIESWTRDTFNQLDIFAGMTHGST
jgi:5'-3' exonuclease